MRRLWLALIVALVSGAAFAAAPTVSAVLTRPASAWAGSSIGAPSRAVRIGAVTPGYSKNWSGYDVTPPAIADTYDSVSGKWVQPTITCVAGAPQEAVFWVGIDGQGSRSVEKVGTAATCMAGKVAYFSWWEMFPKGQMKAGPVPMPGDNIAASVTFDPATSKYELDLTDHRNGVLVGPSIHQNEACGAAPPATCPNLSAEWIAEAPAAFGVPRAPLANFGTWTLTDANATLAGPGGASGSISATTPPTRPSRWPAGTR